MEWLKALRRRLDTLSEKTEVNDSSSDELVLLIGVVIVRLQWSKEQILFQNRRIEDRMRLALKLNKLFTSY